MQKVRRLVLEIDREMKDEAAAVAAAQPQAQQQQNEAQNQAPAAPAPPLLQVAAPPPPPQPRVPPRKSPRRNLNERYAAYCDTPAAHCPADEVDNYLKEPTTGDKDLLQWWKKQVAISNSNFIVLLLFLINFSI